MPGDDVDGSATTERVRGHQESAAEHVAKLQLIPFRDPFHYGSLCLGNKLNESSEQKLNGNEFQRLSHRHLRARRDLVASGV